MDDVKLGFYMPKKWTIMDRRFGLRHSRYKTVRNGNVVTKIGFKNDPAFPTCVGRVSVPQHSSSYRAWLQNITNYSCGAQCPAKQKLKKSTLTLSCDCSFKIFKKSMDFNINSGDLKFII